MAFLIQNDDNSSSQEEEYDTSLSKKELRDLRLAFDSCETFPKSNEINSKKLITVLRSLGRNPSTSDVQEMTNEMDHGTGRIRFMSFLKAMENKMKDDKLDEELKDAFRVFDKDGNGTVPVNEIRAVLRVAVDGIKEKEINEMMEDMDMNNDGVLDYHEFVSMLDI